MTGANRQRESVVTDDEIDFDQIETEVIEQYSLWKNSEITLRSLHARLMEVPGLLGLLRNCPDATYSRVFDHFREQLAEVVRNIVLAGESLRENIDLFRRLIPCDAEFSMPILAPTAIECYIDLAGKFEFFHSFSRESGVFPEDINDVEIMQRNLPFLQFGGFESLLLKAVIEIREARSRYISDTKTAVDHADFQKRLGNAADIAPVTLNDKSPTKPKKRRRKSTNKKVNPLTNKQIEALRLDGECQGNMSDVARRMGIKASTARQHRDAANKKLAIVVSKKAATERLKTDRRGQEVIQDNHDDE